jgi:hypothetical protein
MKRKYQVIITEKLEKTVEVEASSRNEAIALAKINYYDSDPILSADDFAGVTFSVPRERQHER